MHGYVCYLDMSDLMSIEEVDYSEISVNINDAALGGVPCKEELSKMLDYIDSLKYHDHVDYDFIYKLSEQGAKSVGGDIKDPYDWEKTVKRTVTATLKAP
ncbi:hypothetical protein KIN20_026452 [Parelaphostrongylus tenuis]|uniref:Uncharacterized protein n=1 Tax=Parelaphostrongylus tenuis TaxID=148309 RepID=A0AAD5QY26_PARTN|nr:hypothetical protein KIN20_026452 [Parelaphostrongylus tenuis]